MRVHRRLLWLSVIAAAGFATPGYDGMRDHQARTAAGAGAPRPESASMGGAPTPRSRRRSLLELDKLDAVRARPPAGQLFARKSWYVPPPPPPRPPPPPPPRPVVPTAPPLPFQFIGRMIDAQRLTVFLVKDGRVHVVSEGDVIDGAYKLEKIEPRQLTFVYLPLASKQTLAVRDPP